MKRREHVADEASAAWVMLPAVAVIAAIPIVPLAGTVWESLHLHDRM